MKKQIKILGVLAVALTLGLSACNGGGGKDSSGGKDGSSSRHQHTAAENAPWQHDESRHWKDCVANDGGKVDNKAHDFEDVSIIKDSTCTEVGSKNVKCKVCGFETTKEIALKDHEYIADTSKTDVAANCTEEGHTYTVCKNCGLEHDEVIPALGHDWGEWEVIKAAKCEETGSRKHTCSRCNLVEDEVIPALGHNVITKDTAEPLPGKATVRIYECQNEGCDVTYLGFKATEVTDESKARLVFEETADGEKGARFFGHPIGNDVELDPTTGDPSEGNAAVYSKEQTGDFFEYKFDLTADQVSVLGEECLLYCDAQPANWMQQNNMDFFAKGSETDWTKAYYIDDDPNHYQQAKDEEGNPKVDEEGNPVMEAKEIEGWRYVLYVDGHYQDFDKTVAKNKMSNNNRAEFVMPYIFRLHAGENTISLRMAAGYRCTFYNFTFRPYVAPTPIVVNETSLTIEEGKTAQITSSMEGLVYTSANSRVASVNAEGLVTGVAAGQTTITVSKEGNYREVEIPVTVTQPTGVIQVEAETGVSNPEGAITTRVPSGGASGSMTNAWPKDATLTIKFNNPGEAGEYAMALQARGSATLSEVMSIKLNGADIDLAGLSLNSSYTMVSTSLGRVNLLAGENTIVVTGLADSGMPNLDFFRFQPASELPPEPVDPWILDTETVMPTPAADGALVKRYIQEGKDDVKYEIEAKTGNFKLADGSAWKTDPTSGKFKLNKDGHSFSFNFALPKAFEGKMYQNAYMDSYKNNYTKKLYYETNNHANIEVKVNGGDAIDLSQFATTTFQEIFGDGTGLDNSEVKDVEIGDVVLSANNTISYKRVETLNMIVSKFVFIGKDHVHANWTDGAKVEKTATTSAYQNGECSCGAKRVLIDVASDLNGKITKRGAKLGAKGDVAKYVFPVPAEAVGKTAQLYFKATVDNAGNYNYNYYTGKNGGSSAVTLPDNKTNTEVKFNSNVVVLPTTSYKNLGMTGLDEAGAGTFLVNTVTLAASNELTLERLDSFGVQYFEIFVVYE